jgi:hypothetical protein
MLRVFKYIRADNNECIQEGFKLGYIVPVSSGYDQGQRHSHTVYEHMAFAAVFFPGQ